MISLAGCELAPDQDAMLADTGPLPRLYQSEEPLAFDLAAPFSLVNRFAGAFTERPGVLTIGGVEIPVKVIGRGRTSRFECSFDKLEISFDEEPAVAGDPSPRDLTVGTAFEGVPSFNLGTHCAVQSLVIGEELPEGSLSDLGRLVADVAPMRERVAYRIYGALNPISHLTRPATVRYFETAGAASPARPKLLFVKPALIVERFKHLRKRHDGIELEPADVLERDDVDRATLAIEFLFQTLISNSDWQVGDLGATGTLPTTGGPDGPVTLWNHHAMALTGDAPLRVAIPVDFDIAGLVTLWPDRKPRPGEFTVARSANIYRRRLAAFDTVFTVAERRAARQTLRNARAAILGIVEAAPIDDAGRSLMLTAIETFYRAL